VAYTGFLRVSSSPTEESHDVVFPSPGASSIAAALIHFRYTNRFQAACEIAQADCKAFERQAVLRPAFG
jgi:hypothetical protein